MPPVFHPPTPPHPARYTTPCTLTPRSHPSPTRPTPRVSSSNPQTTQPTASFSPAGYYTSSSHPLSVTIPRSWRSSAPSSPISWLRRRWRGRASRGLYGRGSRRLWRVLRRGGRASIGATIGRRGTGVGRRRFGWCFSSPSSPLLPCVRSSSRSQLRRRCRIVGFGFRNLRHRRRRR